MSTTTLFVCGLLVFFYVGIGLAITVGPALFRKKAKELPPE